MCIFQPLRHRCRGRCRCVLVVVVVVVVVSLCRCSCSCCCCCCSCSSSSSCCCFCGQFGWLNWCYQLMILLILMIMCVCLCHIGATCFPWFSLIIYPLKAQWPSGCGRTSLQPWRIPCWWPTLCVMCLGCLTLGKSPCRTGKSTKNDYFQSLC